MHVKDNAILKSATCTYICQIYTLMYPGEFGIVYRGVLSGWRGKEQELVAVKTLKGTYGLTEQIKDTTIHASS